MKLITDKLKIKYNKLLCNILDRSRISMELNLHNYVIAKEYRGVYNRIIDLNTQLEKKTGEVIERYKLYPV